MSVRFQIEVMPERMAEWQAAGLESKLKLTSKFATSEFLASFALCIGPIKKQWRICVERGLCSPDLQAHDPAGEGTPSSCAMIHSL